MYVSHLSCPKCDATYESENLIQLCKCGAPLLVDYDLLKVQAVFKKENAKGSRAQLVAVPGAIEKSPPWPAFRRAINPGFIEELYRKLKRPKY